MYHIILYYIMIVGGQFIYFSTQCSLDNMWHNKITIYVEPKPSRHKLKNKCSKMDLF